MQDFRKLAVFHKARALTLELNRATQCFPREETYGLTSQIRRAAVSICANLAEGCGRSGDPELRRFADIAMGSASELECLVEVAFDLKYVKHEQFDFLIKRIVEVKKMLPSLIVQLRSAGSGRQN